MLKTWTTLCKFIAHVRLDYNTTSFEINTDLDPPNYLNRHINLCKLSSLFLASNMLKLDDILCTNVDILVWFGYLKLNIE